MCGRFTLLTDQLKLKNRFRLSKINEELLPRYNIAPGENVFAVIFDGKKNRAGYLRWGLVPHWAKDEKIGYKMINARVETAHVKPSFKNLLTRKRCLVVADSFYEWQKTDNGKRVHRIQVKNNELFGFAALWDKWEYEGRRLFTCTLLTKDANDFMRSIHHRMPIIIPEHLEQEWLARPFRQAEEVQSFLTSFTDPDLSSYEVTDYVNYAKNDDPACIKPLQQ